MTVTTDIATNAASERYVYLAVDGLEPLLFQRGDRAAPTTWSRSTKTCLHPPAESSLELDLGEMEPELSAMTFWLDEIKNADRTSFFGQLFAPNAWASANHARVKPGLVATNNIPANAQSFPVKATFGFSAPGNAYLGQEAINYTSVTATSFNGVTKGLYPCVNIGQTYGWTVDRPPEGAQGYLYHVGQKPFSFFGRRVAMYLTTWDKTTNDWRPESESRLVWAGRITDRIIRDGLNGWWKLSCKSITDELSNDVFRTGGEEKLWGINMSGVKGRRVDLKIFGGSGGLNYSIFDHPLCENKFFAGIGAFVASVAKQLAAIPWPVQTIKSFTIKQNNGKAYFVSEAFPGQADVKITITPAQGDGEFNHVLNALGFNGFRGLDVNFTSGKKTETAGGTYYYIYQPHDRSANGSSMYLVKDGSLYPTPNLVDSQGDQGSAVQRAYVMMEKATLDAVTKEDGAYFGSYTSKSTGFPASIGLSAEPVKLQNFSAFSGVPYGTAWWDGPPVQQVLIPKYKEVKRTRGPFEMLLNMLVSTGVKGYNGTYDVYPSGWGLAIQRELVDEQSFLNADKAVLPSGLAQRKTYIIPEPTAWMELAKRECKLFGYAVVIRKGKIAVRRVLDTNVDDWTVHLNESVRAGDDRPDSDVSQSVVVNRYKAEIVFNHRTGKYGAPYIINDVDSQLGTSVTKEVSVKHPGVYASSDIKKSTAGQVSSLLKTELLGRFIRYPSAIVQVTLGPSMEDRVFVGDKVKFTTTTMMDYKGTGNVGFTAFATVLQTTWNWERHVGEASILIHDYQKHGQVFTPSAKLDLSSGSNAGWHDTSKNLVLVGNEFGLTTAHDGQAMSTSGWKVKITEYAPTDPSSPQTFAALNVVGYHTANKALVLAPGTQLSGWDNAKEYTVSFGPYTEVNTSQIDDGAGASSGVWVANIDSESISGVLPFRWG